MRKKAEQAKWLQDLEEEVCNNKFLHDWLADSKQGLQEFLADKSTDKEKEIAAQAMGYRSARSAAEHWQRAHLVLDRFVNEKAFQTLWEILKKHDKEHGGFTFSSRNGGFPASLIRALRDWYMLPKFTKTERNQHHKKIQMACEELLSLLGQVAYSTSTDVSFSGFYHLNPDEVSSLFDWFNSPQKWRKEMDDGRYRAYLGLTRASITPIWAVEYIKRMASYDYDHERFVLPTKIRAKNAMRTFMIKRLWHELKSSLLLENAADLIPKELFAEIVGLVVDADCTADDVRKALVN